MTLLLVTVIFLNIPLIRAMIVFAYLSFVPGFVILKLFKLKKLGILKTLLLSVGLSLFSSMLVGLLVNELYVILGFSQPLSIIPITTAMSIFTLTLYFINYRRDFSLNFVFLNELEATRSYLPFIAVLIFLPILSIVGAFYVNIPIMIFVYITIAFLGVLSVATKVVPEKLYPFLIFSVSISIVLLNVMISRYIIGDDANTEYYVFKVAQIRGFWGSINASTYFWMGLNFNSMLSDTLLPNIYSILMNVKNELLFKILYSFIVSLVPLTLYGIFKNETGKVIGLLSTLFFVFSINGFFGELLNVNKQIVGELFLILSIFIWLDKTLPIKEKRILLIIFGLSLAVSHYSLAIIYSIFVSFVVIFSSVKPKFDDVFNAPIVLAIIGGTFLWQAFSPGSTLSTIINIVQRLISELTNFNNVTAGSASIVYAIPQVFTAASWYNLAVSGIVTLSLIIGILIVLVFSRRMEISDKYKLITIFGAIVLAVSFLFPSIASAINFTRLYGIALLFLSPCFAIGVLIFLKAIQGVLRKKNQINNIVLLNHGKTALLLVALLLSAYFLSQSGFINYVTDGGIKGTIFDYYRMGTSSDPSFQSQFYSYYTSTQDVFSAVWLSKYETTLSIVYSDQVSYIHVLISEGLFPQSLIIQLTNTTKPEKNTFLYLSTLNIVKGTLLSNLTYFHTSEISSALNASDLIYSNGNSAIWTVDN